MREERWEIIFSVIFLTAIIIVDKYLPLPKTPQYNFIMTALLVVFFLWFLFISKVSRKIPRLLPVAMIFFIICSIPNSKSSIVVKATLDVDTLLRRVKEVSLSSAAIIVMGKEVGAALYVNLLEIAGLSSVSYIVICDKCNCTLEGNKVITDNNELVVEKLEYYLSFLFFSPPIKLAETQILVNGNATIFTEKTLESLLLTLLEGWIKGALVPLVVVYNTHIRCNNTCEITIIPPFFSKNQEATTIVVTRK